MRSQVKNIILLIFFLSQLLGIALNPYYPTRLFCWAPYDQLSTYDIEVFLDDRQLSVAEFEKAFRMSPIGRENRSIYNLIDILKSTAERFQLENRLYTIELSFKINGHQSGTWSWPKGEIVLHD